jgi:hypothetical protein
MMIRHKLCAAGAGAAAAAAAAAATAAMAVLWSAGGHSALPPQYTRWQDFGAIAAQSSIPAILGVVDRIEWAAGKYVVRAGPCAVDVSVLREIGRGPDGTPIVGPSVIKGVAVGEKRCG